MNFLNFFGLKNLTNQEDFKSKFKKRMKVLRDANDLCHASSNAIASSNVVLFGSEEETIILDAAPTYVGFEDFKNQPKKSLYNSKLLYGNIWLIFVAMTFIIFNLFKQKFFSGKLIQILELFYMSVTLFIAFYFTSVKKQNKRKEKSIMLSMQNSLLMLFIVMMINSFNPWKDKMSGTQLNIFSSVLIFSTFNIFQILNNKFDNLEKMMYIPILIAMHSGRIYINNK